MIEELKALAEKATPGPWHEPEPDGCLHVKLASPWREGAWDGDDEAKSNAALIVALVNNLPAILSALEAVPVMKDAIDNLGEALFHLSDKLKGSGFLNDDANHAEYEKVVAAFQALAALEGK